MVMEKWDFLAAQRVWDKAPDASVYWLMDLNTPFPILNWWGTLQPAFSPKSQQPESPLHVLCVSSGRVSEQAGNRFPMQEFLQLQVFVNAGLNNEPQRPSPDKRKPAEGLGGLRCDGALLGECSGLRGTLLGHFGAQSPTDYSCSN